MMGTEYPEEEYFRRENCARSVERSISPRGAVGGGVISLDFQALRFLAPLTKNIELSSSKLISVLHKSAVYP